MSSMLYERGSAESFKCEDCGCNLFVEVETVRGARHECNGCGALYEVVEAIEHKRDASQTKAT